MSNHDVTDTSLTPDIEAGGINKAQTRKLEEVLDSIPSKVPKLDESDDLNDEEEINVEEIEEDKLLAEEGEEYDLNDLKEEEYENIVGESSQDLLETTNDADEDDIGQEDYEVISDSEDSITDNLDLEDADEEYEDSSESENESASSFDQLRYIRECQKEIEEMNQQANMEILRVEQKFNKLKMPIFEKRNNFISRVPKFWSRTILNHTQLQSVFTQEDKKCLGYLKQLVIQDFKNDRSTGYKIKFIFDPNPWFENSIVIKEYHLPWHGLSSCTCTPIHWREDMDLTTRKSSFFCWFTNQKDTSADDIAEIIKEEIWADPVRVFEGKNANTSHDDSVVLLDETNEDDEDSVEYISSGDENWDQTANSEDENIRLMETTQNSNDNSKIDVSEDSILDEEGLEGEYGDSEGEYADGTIDLEPESYVDVNVTETSQIEEEFLNNHEDSNSKGDGSVVNESSRDTNGIHNENSNDINTDEGASANELPLSLASNNELTDEESSRNSNKKPGTSNTDNVQNDVESVQ